jgi:flagellar protein FliO/FliZ
MDLSVVGLFARLAVSLAVVLGLMALVGRYLRQRGGTIGSRRGGAPAVIEVLARQGLGRTTSVTVVRAAGRLLVLGVTDSSVQLLSEGDPDSIEMTGSPFHSAGAPRTGPAGSGERADSSWTWKSVLDTARERTVRRP